MAIAKENTEAPPVTATEQPANGKAVAKPFIDPPPGTKVDVTAKWSTAAGTAANGKPEAQPLPLPGAGYQPPQRAYPRALNLAEFLQIWRDAEGVEDYQMMVVRRADNPRATFRKPCGVTTNKGMYKFNPRPSEFTKDLQYINGGSGGEFTIQLYDDNEYFIDDVDATWTGVIDDPLTNEGQSEAQAKSEPEKPQTLLEMLREQNALKTEMEKFVGVKPSAESGTSGITKAIEEAQVVPTLMTAMVGMLSTSVSGMAQAMKTIQENSGGGEEESISRMAVKEIMHDSELRSEVRGMFKDGLGAVASLVGGLAQKRNAGKQERPAINSTQTESNPQVNTGTTNKPLVAGDAVTYILQCCEKNEPIDVPTDAYLERFSVENFVQYSILKGTLKRKSVAELKALILSNTSEEIRPDVEKIFALPHADEFLQNLKQSVA